MRRRTYTRAGRSGFSPGRGLRSRWSVRETSPPPAAGLALTVLGLLIGFAACVLFPDVPADWQEWGGR